MFDSVDALIRCGRLGGGGMFIYFEASNQAGNQQRKDENRWHNNDIQPRVAPNTNITANQYEQEYQ